MCQVLCVYFHHKCSGIERQSLPPSPTTDLNLEERDFHTLKCADLEVCEFCKSKGLLDTTPAWGFPPKVGASIPEDVLEIACRIRILWSLF